MKVKTQKVAAHTLNFEEGWNFMLLTIDEIFLKRLINEVYIKN